MICCLCNGEIERKYTPDGKMYWDKGNNPYPVKGKSKYNSKRCCDKCNMEKVIPARIALANTQRYIQMMNKGDRK